MSDQQTLREQRLREKAYQLWQEAGSPEGEDDRFWQQAIAATEHEEDALDETVEESFPASDPPANSGIIGPQVARKRNGRQAV
ncbi:Protein of unknown function (DUF2934) [Humitalea rosea]|uniref:DUF2934 family protein n=1 Tax=Humitalea rosea TaxID=990373 RepID=A0A2W7KKV9_9PROT|nr:DUF2934 domain-containing protein [Humitalea rosea]PZW48775.1 Protein of unknown function (DUF2934) [Humitalea rosea]